MRSIVLVVDTRSYIVKKERPNENKGERTYIVQLIEFHKLVEQEISPVTLYSPPFAFLRSTEYAGYCVTFAEGEIYLSCCAAHKQPRGQSCTKKKCDLSISF